MLRACGVNYDIRKVDGYGFYPRFKFRFPLGEHGDTYDRLMMRALEMRESVQILKQAFAQIQPGPVMNPKAKIRAFRPPAGEAYGRIEAPKGELGFYLISDGSPNPYRYRVRPPSFINLTILEDMCLGHTVADVMVILGSIDIVMGEVRSRVIWSAGILKGMAVTARNFVGSYFEKDRLITVQYPEERIPLPENYRNFPFLIFDGERSACRAALCRLQDLREGMSAAVHLHRQKRRQKARLHGQTAVLSEVFDIDISVCMSCQICVEVCPFEAIKMDKEFELSQRERFNHLLLRKNDLAKSNQFYHKIHPVEAASVDKGLADAAAAAEAKKRAAAEAAAKAAAAKAAVAKATEAKPAPDAPTPSQSAS